MSAPIKPVWTVTELARILQWDPRRLRRWLAYRGVRVEAGIGGSSSAVVYVSDLRDAWPELWDAMQAVGSR